MKTRCNTTTHRIVTTVSSGDAVRWSGSPGIPASSMVESEQRIDNSDGQVAFVSSMPTRHDMDTTLFSHDVATPTSLHSRSEPRGVASVHLLLQAEIEIKLLSARKFYN
jgi:hypothetical protein